MTLINKGVYRIFSWYLLIHFINQIQGVNFGGESDFNIKNTHESDTIKARLYHASEIKMTHCVNDNNLKRRVESLFTGRLWGGDWQNILKVGRNPIGGK